MASLAFFTEVFFVFVTFFPASFTLSAILLNGLQTKLKGMLQKQRKALLPYSAIFLILLSALNFYRRLTEKSARLQKTLSDLTNFTTSFCITFSASASRLQRYTSLLAMRSKAFTKKISSKNGFRLSINASSASSSKEAACRTAPKWEQYRFLRAETGECRATHALPFG